MQKEAAAVYDSYLNFKHNIRPEYQDETKTHRPWSHTHYTESSLRTAHQMIYDSRSEETAPYYAHGTPDGDNWIIRWCLYHVIRYRDIRNQKTSRSDSISSGNMISSLSCRRHSRRVSATESGQISPRTPSSTTSVNSGLLWCGGINLDNPE